MIKGACACPPDSLSFVIQENKKGKPESIQEDSFCERKRL